MRFMIMHKVDARMEAGSPPDQRIISGMGALVQESLKEGVFLTGAGLHPSSKRARLERRSGEWSESLGQYTGSNELVSSFAMIRAESLADAARHARHFAEASATSEVEIGPIVEPWDLGIVPKPIGDVPHRFLILAKAHDDFETTGVTPDAQDSALRALVLSLGEAGAVLAAEVLAPSSKASRLSASSGGKRTWVDGPFAESKELVAGFSIIEVPSKADAITWADRYAAILGGNEVDIRELA